MHAALLLQSPALGGSDSAPSLSHKALQPEGAKARGSRPQPAELASRASRTRLGSPVLSLGPRRSEPGSPSITVLKPLPGKQVAVGADRIWGPGCLEWGGGGGEQGSLLHLSPWMGGQVGLRGSRGTQVPGAAPCLGSPPPISRPGAGQAWGTCARADRDNVRPPSDPRASSERTAAPAARQRWGDGGCHLGPLRAAPLSTTKLPCLSSSPTSPVTGPHPLPQQHDPIINKSFLDPPLPRAPSGTLAAAAAADPFQKGGVAAARGSGRGGPSAGRGRGRAAVTGQERTLRTCAGHPLVEGGHTPGSGLGCGAERGVASPR